MPPHLLAACFAFAAPRDVPKGGAGRGAFSDATKC
jgi:hypothetical protein